MNTVTLCVYAFAQAVQSKVWIKVKVACQSFAVSFRGLCVGVVDCRVECSQLCASSVVFLRMTGYVTV